MVQSNPNREAQRLEDVTDAAVGGDRAAVTEGLDRVVRTGLAQTGTPGAVLVADRPGRPALRRAWGAARTHDDAGPLPDAVPMRVDTLFDVASLTKIVVTTAIAMVLVQRGRLDLEATVSRFVPEFRGPWREQVTVGHLLEHRSGLPDWAPLFLRAADPTVAIAALCDEPLVDAPGHARRYSDLGMALLGVVVERVADAALDELARRLVLEPLEMEATSFRPQPESAATAAATSTGNPVEQRMLAERFPDLDPTTPGPWWRDRVLAGEVNDANAAVAFGGVAGHAGLFSTGDDLLRFGQALLAAARGSDVVFSAEIVRRFTRPASEPLQGLGFWLRRIDESDETDASFGHPGFTGCELLVDPAKGLVVVFLSNRLHGPYPPPSHENLWRPVLRALLDERR